MTKYDKNYEPASALAIFAHPDDPEFLVAGTIAKWASAGCKVNYLLCTTGDAGSHDASMSREQLSDLRKSEQVEACKVLGVQVVQFLHFHDCELEANLELRRAITQSIRRFKPEIVICEDPIPVIYSNAYLPGQENINHPDHRAAGIATIDAVFPCASMPMLWPELGPPHQVKALYLRGNSDENTAIDISDTIDLKVRALKKHRSQLGDWDPTETILAWARLEGSQASVEYAEIFRVVEL